MNGIGTYGVAGQSYYNTSLQSNSLKKEKTTAYQQASTVYEKKNAAAKNVENKTTQLTDKAKALLEELREKYGDTDFIVADYATDEEAAQYLSRGTKTFNVLIEPELLNQMAEDEEVKQKNLDLLEQSRKQLSEMATKLGDDKENVKNMGIAIHDDGTVSLFAELEKTTKKQMERIEQAREEKRAEAKEAKEEKREEKLKTRVQASTAEELLEKIRNVDWKLLADKEKIKEVSSVEFTV